MRWDCWVELCDKYRFFDKIDETIWACWRPIRDFISPYWYRVFGFKHHIIKTKLTPKVWYDSDTRMLYAVMAIVEWFVRNDMRIVTLDEFEKELERIKEEGGEYRDSYMESWTMQYDRNIEIIGIYKWWKDYPNREKEIADALHTWHAYNESFMSDKKNFMSFFSAQDKMSEEQKKEEKRLSEHLHTLELKLEVEEQQMLKKAIDLRAYMWS
jgi:hypothetical protein